MLNVLNDGLRDNVPERKIPFPHQPDFSARNIILRRFVVSGKVSDSTACWNRRYALEG